MSLLSSGRLLRAAAATEKMENEIDKCMDELVFSRLLSIMNENGLKIGGKKVVMNRKFIFID
jgi:hypothetical protein